MTPDERVKKIVSDHREAVERFFAESTAVIRETVDLVADCLDAGKTVFAFGNGGSAADASHFAAELVNRFMKDRSALPALALTTDPAVITSIANDYGYERVFTRQLEALGREGDLALGISTSGRSPNVIHGLEAARVRGLTTIALTGGAEGPMAESAHIVLSVPSPVTARVQEVHGLFLHILCELVEDRLFD